MRIVAGEWKGRVIKAPRGTHVRPTRDRVREAWMSIVQPLLPDARVLDLCAGSGALGLEALSRGAAEATFVDSDPRSVQMLRDNIATLHAADRAHVIRGDALKFVAALPAHAYDVAFADPPYADALAVQLAERWLTTPYARTIGIEHASSIAMPPGGDTRRYGTSSITFYHVSLWTGG